LTATGRGRPRNIVLRVDAGFWRKAAPSKPHARQKMHNVLHARSGGALIALISACAQTRRPPL